MVCDAWASAMSARVSRVPPQFSLPAHLWWEMTTGSPASRPMRMVSRTESEDTPLLVAHVRRVHASAGGDAPRESR